VEELGLVTGRKDRGGEEGKGVHLFKSVRSSDPMAKRVR
jgi:hypothetical protein